MPSSQLESRLRYEFRNAELLRQALTHRSHSATHNERLEFLGDSVLNCAVAALLFQRFGKLDEGDLSRVRANLVKQQSLYEIAQALNIAEGLHLGEGELRSGGFRRPSILADAFEAIIGAVFLDGGFEAAQAVIKRLYVPILDHIDPRTLGKDAKTLLQEYLQGHKIALPTYTVVATHGAAHNQQFEVECTVPKLDVKVSGSGASRRAAEQAAAKKALDEVMSAVPALAAKPKRSKNARAAKHAEPEIVPGVKGVQEALDLRAPDRKERRAAQAADAKAAPQPGAEQPAHEHEHEHEQNAAAEAPVAVIRAAHVEHSADKPERTAKPAEKAPEKAAAVEKAADKTPEKALAAEKASDHAPKAAGAEKAADNAPNAAGAEKAPDNPGKTTAAAKAEPRADVSVRSSAPDKPARVRDAAAPLLAPAAAETDVAAVPAPVRVADAGR